jgi:diguanylate cyclase (GGDEF)-like protein
MASGLSLQGHVDVLQDPTGQLGVDDLLDPAAGAAGAAWTRPAGLLRLHGPSTWWLRFRLQAPATDDPWLLAFPTTAIRDIAFHGPYAADGLAWGPGAETGLIRPYATRPLGQERITYPLQMPLAGEYTVFIRLQNTVAQNVTPSVWLLPDYLANRQHKRLLDGLIYGVLLTLLIYNLALTVVLRDSTYGFYVLTCAAALLTIATFNGHTAHYLWPAQPWWIEHSYQIWPALWLACKAAFARSFLNTRSAGRLADVAVLGLGGLALLSAVLAVSGQLLASQSINEGLALGGVAIIIMIAVWLWRRGHPTAIWYLSAHLILFVCVVGVVAVARGWWNAPFVLSYGLQIGIAAEMVVLAVALSARIRGIQQEEALLRRQTGSLTQEVQTDPLTGLLNRRGLAERAEPLLAQPGQHAVLLIDLDRFKPVNDRHGHAVGDQVLVAIGQRLAHHCRQSDLAARLGGDEFVIILGHCPPRPALDHMVQRLCDAVDRPIDILGHVHQVSASAGVAMTQGKVRDLKPLLRCADQAMYAAKKEQTRFAFALADDLSG